MYMCQGMCVRCLACKGLIGVYTNVQSLCICEAHTCP